MNQGRIDATTKEIATLLDAEYRTKHQAAQIEVYRYNPASIRIRIVDLDFKGKSRTERDNEVWPILQKLPDSSRLDITMCLLLAPEEKESSVTSVEFEQRQCIDFEGEFSSGQRRK